MICLNLAFNGITITQGLILPESWLSPNMEETLHVIKTWGWRFDNETTLRIFFEQLKEPSTCATNVPNVDRQLTMGCVLVWGVIFLHFGLLTMFPNVDRQLKI